LAKAYGSTVRAFQIAGAPGALRLQHPRLDDEQAGQYYRGLFNR